MGTSFALEEGHILWVGQLSGVTTDGEAETPFENAGVQCPGSLDIRTSDGTGTGQGYCIFTTVAGDKAFATWSCQGGAPMSGKPCVGETKFTGGTGKLQGITGGNTFEASTVAFNPDGMGSGYTDTDNKFTLPE